MAGAPDWLHPVGWWPLPSVPRIYQSSQGQDESRNG